MWCNVGDVEASNRRDEACGTARRLAPAVGITSVAIRTF